MTIHKTAKRKRADNLTMTNEVSTTTAIQKQGYGIAQLSIDPHGYRILHLSPISLPSPSLFQSFFSSSLGSKACLTSSQVALPPHSFFTRSS